MSIHAETNIKRQIYSISAREDNRVIYLDGAFNVEGDGKLLPSTIPGEPDNLGFTFEVGRAGLIAP